MPLEQGSGVVSYRKAINNLKTAISVRRIAKDIGRFQIHTPTSEYALHRPESDYLKENEPDEIRTLNSVVCDIDSAYGDAGSRGKPAGNETDTLEMMDGEPLYSDTASGWGAEGYVTMRSISFSKSVTTCTLSVASDDDSTACNESDGYQYFYQPNAYVTDQLGIFELKQSEDGKSQPIEDEELAERYECVPRQSGSEPNFTRKGGNITRDSREGVTSIEELKGSGKVGAVVELSQTEPGSYALNESYKKSTASSSVEEMEQAYSNAVQMKDAALSVGTMEPTPCNAIHSVNSGTYVDMRSFSIKKSVKMYTTSKTTNDKSTNCPTSDACDCFRSPNTDDTAQYEERNRSKHDTYDANGDVSEPCKCTGGLSSQKSYSKCQSSDVVSSIGMAESTGNKKVHALDDLCPTERAIDERFECSKQASMAFIVEDSVVGEAVHPYATYKYDVEMRSENKLKRAPALNMVEEYECMRPQPPPDDEQIYDMVARNSTEDEW